MSSWPSLAFPWAECPRTGKPASSLCAKWLYLKIQGEERYHEGAGDCVGVTHQIQCTESWERRIQSSHSGQEGLQIQATRQTKQAACRVFDNVPYPSLRPGIKHDKQKSGSSTLFSLHVTIIMFGNSLTFKCIPSVPFSPQLKIQSYSPTGDQTVLYSTAHTGTGGAKVHADCCCRHWSSPFQFGLMFYSTQKLHSSRKHWWIQRH